MTKLQKMKSNVDEKYSNANIKNPKIFLTQVEPGNVKIRRRAMGPAMPPTETWVAATRLIEAEVLLRTTKMELENVPVVGSRPPTPSVVTEAAFVSDAECFEEATRMLHHAVGNAYEVLGVKPDVGSLHTQKDIGNYHCLYILISVRTRKHMRLSWLVKDFRLKCKLNMRLLNGGIFEENSRRVMTIC